MLCAGFIGVFVFYHCNKLPENTEINSEVVFADKLQSREVFYLMLPMKVSATAHKNVA